MIKEEQCFNKAQTNTAQISMQCRPLQAAKNGALGLNQEMAWHPKVLNLLLHLDTITSLPKSMRIQNIQWEQNYRMIFHRTNNGQVQANTILLTETT